MEEKDNSCILQLCLKHVTFLQEIFKKMDWDRNGTISRTEFKSYLQEMKKGEEINMEEVMRAFKNMDKNQDNQISWDEFYVSDHLIRHSSRKFLTYAK